MARFALVPYRIRVKNIRSKDYLQLDNLHGKDVTKIMRGALKLGTGTHVFDESKKTLSVRGKVTLKGRHLSGTLMSGEYGYEARFYNIETRIAAKWKRLEKHSEALPFFFLFHLPKGKTAGFLILQRFKNFGVKTVLRDYLNNVLKPMNLAVEINPMISHELLEKIEQSRLVSLRMIRYDVPRDIADYYHEGSATELTIEKVIRAKVGDDIRLTKRIKKMLADSISDQEPVYYEILDERWDEIKAKIVEVDGKSRKTLTFGPKHAFRESMPLDIEDMEMRGGFPTYKYLLGRAEGYLSHLLERMKE